MGSNLYNERDKNVRRTWLIMVLFFLVIVGLGSLFGYVLDFYALPFIAVVVALLMNIWAYWQSDKMVLSIAGAREINQQNPEEKEIHRLVENLAITAGLPTPKVYVMEERALNAFATGRDPEHGVIAVTRGLMDHLDRTEMEGVLAHELSHIGNRDTLIQTIAVTLVGVVVLMSDMFLRMSLFKRNDDSGGQLKMVLTVVALILALLSPLFVQLIQLAISRKREYLADASGALLTRYPDGLAKALEKISSDPQELEKSNKATAHMYISNPLKNSKSFLSNLGSTHPPVKERIKALMGMDVESQA